MENHNPTKQRKSDANPPNPNKARRKAFIMPKNKEIKEEIEPIKKEKKSKNDYQTFLNSCKKSGIRGVILPMLMEEPEGLLKLNEFDAENNYGQFLEKEENWFDEDEEDSDDDEEFDDDDENEMKKKLRWLINPEGKFKFLWDHLHMLCVFYIAIFFPFKLSFLEDKNIFVLEIIDYMVDAFFLVDLVLNFFIPIYVNHDMITNHKLIAFNYAKFWLWLDFLSIFPLEWIFRNLNSNYSIFIRITKIPKLWKVLRAAKLLRTVRVKKKNPTFIGKLLQFLKSKNAVFVSLLFFSVVSVHFMACAWHFISWNTKDPRSWLIRYGYEHEHIYDRYWASVYFAYTTMSTTGYGDIVPETKNEFLFSSLFMFSGVLFFSQVFTTMNNLFEAKKEAEKEYFDKKDSLKKLKKKYKFFKGKKGLDIYAKMLNLIYYEHYEKDEVEMKIPKFKNVKPQDINKLLLELMKTKYKFSKNIFFQSIPEKLWLRFFDGMKKIEFDAGDIVYERGSNPTHFYVIRKGKVWFLLEEEKIHENDFLSESDEKINFYVEEKNKRNLQRKKNKVRVEENLRKIVLKVENENTEKSFMEIDSYFGEFELFDDKPRKWTVIASEKLTVYSIQKSEFLELFVKREIRKKFFLNLYYRLNKFKLAQKEVLHAVKSFDDDKQNNKNSGEKKGSNETKIVSIRGNQILPLAKNRKQKISNFNPNSKKLKKSKTTFLSGIKTFVKKNFEAKNSLMKNPKILKKARTVLEENIKKDESEIMRAHSPGPVQSDFVMRENSRSSSSDTYDL